MTYEKPARNRNVLVVCQAGVKLAIPIPREISSPVFIGTVLSVDGDRCVVLPLAGAGDAVVCRIVSGSPEQNQPVLIIRQSGEWFCHTLHQEVKE